MKNFSLLKTLNIADLITLLGLIPLILSFHFIIIDKSFHAIITICVAFIFDILDGYIARKLNISSALGRQLDSFLDSFNYLILTCFFIYTFLNFNTQLTFLIIFITLTGGVLRLARHNLTGFNKKNNSLYYTGLIVPYTQFAVITIFFTTIHISEDTIYLLLPILLIISLLMISDFKIKKVKNYTFTFLIIILLIILSITNIV